MRPATRTEKVLKLQGQGRKKKKFRWGHFRGQKLCIADSISFFVARAHYTVQQRIALSLAPAYDESRGRQHRS